MIGDEMAEKLVTFAFRTAGHTLSHALMHAGKKFIESEKSKRTTISIDELSHGQDIPIQGVEISAERVSEFDRFARKYGFQYSLLQQENDPDKYFLTFRQRDIGKLEMVITDMMGDKSREWDDLKETLEHAKERAFEVREKSHERPGKEHSGRDVTPEL